MEQQPPPQQIKYPSRYGLKGANIYIDGQKSSDDTNKPKETNGDGEFNIQVPIETSLQFLKGHALHERELSSEQSFLKTETT
jgi:hypothetical protein